MTIWTNEIKELDKLYESFRGHLPDIVKEMEQLIRTDDPNVVMLYSRRCLEVIVTDLCESELKRPRKTEPLKGIIDKLNSEEKVPSHIITSMHSLNSMSTYGTHPKDFDPEQVKPVLNNLAIIIRWYLIYKDFQIVSKTKSEEEKYESKDHGDSEKVTRKSKKSIILLFLWLLLGFVIIIIIAYIVLRLIVSSDSYEKKMEKKLSALASDLDVNQKYKEVTIGNQVWMAENLKAAYFSDGTPIPQVTDSAEWKNLKTPACCWYNNERDLYEPMFGPLYNWYAVNTGKLCPTGWHVPSDAEWTTLINFLGGDSLAGDKLKTDFWGRTTNISPTAPCETGFTARPGGRRTSSGIFLSFGYDGEWWSSSEYSNSDALYRFMTVYDSVVISVFANKSYGFSVRCVKDDHVK